ncbi:MAG: SHOCT domain-containing protein [Actinomycetota bacterium]|nr:SHOCT domain-containing protein [Actinomycetota bacterium]
MIRRGPSLIRVAATTAVVAGTATAVSGGMRGRQAQKAQAQQAAAAPAPVAPADPTAGEMTDEVISQLKQLADLKNQGILTEEEFSAQKAKLLGE